MNAERTLDRTDEPGRGGLLDAYRGLVLDLDGVVYAGPAALPGAVETICTARSRGVSVVYATNNASRTPQSVAEHLTGLGVDATGGDVVTSAQAAAGVVLEMVGAGARVLVVGGEGLRGALEERDLVPVWSAADDPSAVVQGFAPQVGWTQLAEGAYALQRGLPWVASNMDMTIPTAHGIAPGNGTLVGVLAAAVGRTPDAVAGKPQRRLFDECVRRTGTGPILVVGDRLDTDIAGATAAGMDSALVLTGVSSARDVVAAPADMRPTFVLPDLAAVLDEYIQPLPTGPDHVRCGAVSARVVDGVVEIQVDQGDRRDEGPDAAVQTQVLAVRAAAALVWAARDTGQATPTVSDAAGAILDGGRD